MVLYSILDAFHVCLSKYTTKPDLLPYHAIGMCQKLYEASQLQEKLSNKRVRTDSVQRSKPLRSLPHKNHFGSSSVSSASTRQHKRPKLNLDSLNHSGVVCTSLERDKLSSSSSYERFSAGEVNSPGSGTESSSSAPSKLIENTHDVPSGFGRKPVMEILQEVKASSRMRCACDDPIHQPPVSHQQSRPISSLVSSAHSQSYPSSPASPHIPDRKEATYVPPNVHSNRKHISVKTLQSDHAEIPCIRNTKSVTSGETQIHNQLRSQFDSYMPHSMSFKQQPLSGGAIEAVEFVHEGNSDAKTNFVHDYIPKDESAAAVLHLQRESRIQMGRSQTMRQSRVVGNGSKSHLPDYLGMMNGERGWGTSGYVDNSDSWPRNPRMQISSGNYYGAFVDVEPMRPQHAEKRAFNSNLALSNQSAQNPLDQTHCVTSRSKDLQIERLHRQAMQSGRGFSSSILSVFSRFCDKSCCSMRMH